MTRKLQGTSAESAARFLQTYEVKLANEKKRYALTKLRRKQAELKQARREQLGIDPLPTFKRHLISQLGYFPRAATDLRARFFERLDDFGVNTSERHFWRLLGELVQDGIAEREDGGYRLAKAMRATRHDDETSPPSR